MNWFTKSLQKSKTITNKLDESQDYFKTIAQVTKESIQLVQDAIVKGDANLILSETEQLVNLAKLYEMAKRVSCHIENRRKPISYKVGSLFLYRCLQKLTQGPDEHLFFVTGLEMDKTLTLDHICDFKIESASIVHATGSLQSSHVTLINLENFGHRLHGLFHKHPGKGASSTKPSHIDLETHRRFERGGHTLIGAIFTEDGYVRFFSVNLNFTISIYGQGVKRVEDKLFKLEGIREIPNQTN